MSSEEQTPLLADPEAGLEPQQQPEPQSRRPLYHGRRPLDSEEDEEEEEGDDETAPTCNSKSSSLARRRITLKSFLYTLLLMLCCVALLALALTHLIFGRALSRVLSDPQAAPRLAHAGLITEGPYHLELLHSSDAGLDVELSFHAGVDVRRALEAEAEAAKGERESERWDGMWRWHGMWRWATERAGGVRVDLSAADLRVWRESGGELLALAVADPVSLPLSYGGSGGVRVEEVKMRVQVGVCAPAEVVRLALDAWQREEVAVNVEASRVDVSVGGHWMRRALSMELDVMQPLEFKGASRRPTYYLAVVQLTM